MLHVWGPDAEQVRRVLGRVLSSLVDEPVFFEDDPDEGWRVQLWPEGMAVARKWLDEQTAYIIRYELVSRRPKLCARCFVAVRDADEHSDVDIPHPECVRALTTA